LAVHSISSLINQSCKSAFLVDWQQPPVAIDLLPGQLHVWKVNLDEVADTDACLSEDEKQRAARLKSPQKSARLRKTHCMLRGLLAAYTSQSSADMRFAYGVKGKPRLQSAAGTPTLEFNLSHSENLMLAAFNAEAPVGIDLELIQPISTRERIVRQYFSAHDLANYRTMPADQQNNAFLHAWTCREACGKADGAGFAFGSEMDFFSEQIDSHVPVEGAAFSRTGDFWLLHFNPNSNFTAAAAVKSAVQPQVCFFEIVERDNLIGFSSSPGLKMQTIASFSGYMKADSPNMSWK
jgi:4'-phosphopantetheinyl transferase